MGIELARAFVTVSVNSQPMKVSLADVQKSFSTSMRNAGNSVEEAITPVRSLSSEISSMAGVASLAGGLVTAAFGASARSAVMAAGKYEQTMIAFSTMMGSATKASGLLTDLTRFAAETPFEMPEIEQVARGMVMFGEDSKTLMDTLKMLGNAASGTSSSFGMLGLVYNQIRGVGKLLTQDFRQLSTRGVISLRDIAKHYKITDAAAQEMLSRGKVSFEDFRSILMNLAGENGTGRFAGMMKKQSESMLGLLSTFSDSWRITMRQVGEELVPIAKWFVKLGVGALSSFSGMDSVTKKLIAGTLGFGTVLGGVFTTMASGAFVTSKLISVYTSTVDILGRYAEASRAAALAQGSLNAAMTATPYVLAAVAAALALMMGYKLGQWLADQTEQAKKFNAVLKEQRDQLEFQKGVGMDFTGASEDDVKKFVEATASGIGKAKDHLKEMESKWFANKDAIQLTKDQIALLEDQIGKANEKLLEFAKSEGLPGLDKQIKDVDENMNRLANDIAGTMARLEESRSRAGNKREGALGRWLEADVIAQEKAWESRLEKLRAEQDNESKRSVELRRARENVKPEVDDKATEKIKQKTEALKIANDTYGMSAIQAEVYKMKADKVSEAEIKVYAAERERAEGLKALQQRQELMNKAQEEYVKLLQAQLSQPAILPSQVPDPFSQMSETLPDMWADFDELGQILEEIKTPAERLDDAFSRLKYNFDSGLLSAENYRKSLDAMGRTLTDSVMTPSERMNRQLAEWKQMLDNGAITQETYNKLIKQMGQSVTESVNPQEALKTKVAELDALLKAGSITQETYNKAIWKAKRAMDALSGTSGFVEFGQKIQDMIMRGGPAGAAGGAAGGMVGGPVTAEEAAQAFRSLTPADLATLPGPGGGINAYEAERIFKGDEMVRLMAEANKKTDKVVAAIKEQPKGGLL